jgi:hypothetical protein
VVVNFLFVKSSMSELQLGPNGGLIYCMEYLLGHLEWLDSQLMRADCHYVIFDFPGQVVVLGEALLAICK